jgi:GNAT superfamily N-acetyltransferase
MRSTRVATPTPAPEAQRKSSPLKRLAGRLRRLLQGWRVYRRLGRRVAPTVTLAVHDEPSSEAAAAIRVEAFWRGREVGHVWLVQHAASLPAIIDWWGVAIEVTPGLRGLGVGEVLLNEMIRLATERGGRHLGVLVRADNWPSLGLCAKCGFVADTRSNLAAQWAASHGESRPYVLLWRNLGDAPDPVFPDA